MLTVFNAKLPVEYFYKKASTQNDSEYTTKFFNSLAHSQDAGDILEWNQFATRKYMIGDFDRAYIAFAFAALLNHADSANSAGDLWERGVLRNISCNLGPNTLGISNTYIF